MKTALNTIKTLLPFALLLASCSPKVQPYALTNKVYKTETDSIVQVIKQEQPAVLTDSMGAPIPSSFVGTVNFNM
jgi:N-acetylmuramoyl-L-alanine amidase